MEVVTILNDVKSDKIIYAFPPISGWGIVYQTLADKIESHRFHAFDYCDSDNRDELYAKHILSNNADSEVTLLGYSAGGNIAFEVAKLLEKAGKNIAKFILLDSPPETVVKTRTIEDLNKVSADFYTFLQTIGFIDALNTRYEFETSELLKQNVLRKIFSYNMYLDGLVNSGKIKCDITMLKSTDTDYIKPVDLLNWQKMTEKNLNIFPGFGDHLSMLEKKSLANNFSIIKEIIES